MTLLGPNLDRLFVAGTLAVGLAVAELPPTADQIGERAAKADIEATSILRDYTLMRHYVLDSPRFGKHAEMTVRVTYRPEQGKTFEIVSSQNAEGMSRKVFDKLIEAEKESGRKQDLDSMRIGPKNYAFQLLGMEEKNGYKCYVLALKPRRKSKFLIDGKAWISAADYGVVYVQGRPSERISFWVGKPEISQTFCKVGPVWMMSSNRSNADVKLAGRSELSIESFNFQVIYGENAQVARAAFGTHRSASSE